MVESEKPLVKKSGVHFTSLFLESEANGWTSSRGARYLVRIIAASEERGRGFGPRCVTAPSLGNMWVSAQQPYIMNGVRDVIERKGLPPLAEAVSPVPIGWREKPFVSVRACAQ